MRSTIYVFGILGILMFFVCQNADAHSGIAPRGFVLFCNTATGQCESRDVLTNERTPFSIGSWIVVDTGLTQASIVHIQGLMILTSKSSSGGTCNLELRARKPGTSSNRLVGQAVIGSGAHPDGERSGVSSDIEADLGFVEFKISGSWQNCTAAVNVEIGAWD